MSTLTVEKMWMIVDWLDEHPHLSVGLGTRESACSIAAINLALTGELTDRIPECMSPVIGMWIIGVQDAMPDKIRNSPEWRGLLPLAAGTGRNRERERVGIILDWMWGTVLPHVQEIADRGGLGVEWRQMTEKRSASAAAAVYRAAEVTWVSDAVVSAALSASEAAWSVQLSALSCRATWARDAAASAAREAARVAAWVEALFKGKARVAAWSAFDPVGLLRRLVEVSDD